MHIMLNNLRLYIRQEHGLWRFVAPVVQNVKITHSNAATSITTTRIILATLILPNRLVTGRGLMTRSFGDHRRRTIANPTFTRQSPENLQKIPSNIAQLIVRPIPLHHRRNASQPRNCALFAFGRFPEDMWSFCVFLSDQLIDYTNNCRCQGPWVENSMLDSSVQR